MQTYIKKILSSLAVFALFFGGAWITVDISESIIFEGLKKVEALGVSGCSSCINHDGGGGGGGFFGGGGFGGGGFSDGGGGGGGYTPPTNPPICTLDLTKDKITWSTQRATRVDIVPLTNSPAVPGAVATPNPAPGTVVISKDFGHLVAQYKAKLQQDVGSFVIDGFYANKPTADRICQVIAPGTVSGGYGVDDYKSPKNNTVLIWNGSSWNQYNAKNYNLHFRYNFKCIVPYSTQSPYALSGSANFVPPLGVGTHTYKLIATGTAGNGSKICTATVVVPPDPKPKPVCTLDAIPSTITQGDPVKLKWTSQHATSGSINQGVGVISPVANGHKTIYPNHTKTYTATFTGPGGSTTCSKKVVVNPKPTPTCDLDLTKKKITWSSTHAASVKIYPITSGSPSVGNNLPLNGHKDFNPYLSYGLHAYKMKVVGTNSDVIYCEAEVDIPAPKDPYCELDSISPVPYGTASTLTWTTENGHTFVINKGIGTVTPVAGGSVSTGPLTSTKTFKGTVFGAHGKKATCKTKVKVTPPNAPECTLSASPDSITSGETSTLTWTTNNAVSFVIDNGIGTSTPVAGGSTTTSALNSTTTFVGTAYNAQGDSVTCTADVGVLPQPGPFCTLSVSASEINPGESISVSWTSQNVTSGFVDQGLGTTSPVASGSFNDIFPSDDTQYTATFSGPYGTTTCSAVVKIKKSGCTSNCGGGLDQPNVQLGRITPPTEQPLAFVSLSQVPYTGFEAGTLLTLVFWSAVALWSVGIAYVFVGRGSMQFMANKMFAFAHIPTRRDDEYEESAVNEYNAQEDSVDTSVVVSVASPVAEPVAVAQPVPTPVQTSTPASDGLPSISDVIESRAHAAGVLLSPEAISIAKTLHVDRAETLRMFGDILNEAVRTVPREDGWILISAERMRTLTKEVSVQDSAAPTKAPDVTANEVPKTVAPTLDDSVADRFVATLLSGDRNGAFTILHALEQERSSAARFATSVATLLDKLYRSRKNGAAFDDVALKEKATFITDKGLQELVEVFVHALDTAYQSEYTGLKIAVAQAFDIRST